MRSMLIGAALSGTLFAFPAAAQKISVPALVDPGVPFQVAITNEHGSEELTWIQNALYMLQPSGELAHPFAVQSDIVYSVFPGESMQLPFTAPASGPGSSGSYVMILVAAKRLVTRLDVGTPSDEFPDIHAYPARINAMFDTHTALFTGQDRWEFANTGSSDHTLGPADTLEVISVDGTLSAQMTLEGLVVPAGGVVQVDLPLAGMPAGPYTVLADWVDPGLNKEILSTHGIHPASRLDLALPGGRLVPSEGYLPVHLSLSGFEHTPPIYVFTLGLLPGTTPFPEGMHFPLVADPILLASLDGGLGGVLSGQLGFAESFFGYYGPNYGLSTAATIEINHPSQALIPAGLQLRAAAFAFHPTDLLFGVSQMELIQFE